MILTDMLRIFTSACTLMLCTTLMPARAEVGPCKSDGRNGLICGEGVGAARVIAGSVSPSKRFALAWRSTKTAPLDPNVDEWPYDLEDLLIRLSDGAVLARTTGIYFNTGNMEANRTAQTGSWSPDSHYLVETVEDRWSTPRFELYAIEADDKLIGPVDLNKVVESDLRARLRRSGKNDAGYALQLYEDPHTGQPVVTVDRVGMVRAQAMMHIIKTDVQTTYDVVLKIVQKGPSLHAKLLSIKLAHPQPW